jgi:hypothetical protein
MKMHITKICAVLAALACLALFPSVGSAQGIMVKPMKLELAPPPGETAKVLLEVRNTGAEASVAAEISLCELVQDCNGNWQVVEGETKAAAGLSSCLKWIKLGETAPEIKPGEAVSVAIEVNVPRTARGFHAAGLIVQSKPPPNPRGLTVIVRFLVPVLVEIPGRPLPQKISLADTGLVAVDAQEKKPATTLASLGVANEGGTYSRIKGVVKVLRLSQGHWRPVSTANFREVGILPGMRLDLKSDMKRRLPSGKYKLTANLSVGGRQVKPLEKEVDFVGDPDVTKLAVDTALILDPPVISLVCAPGSLRTATVKVENGSDDEVNIEAGLLAPPSLRGVAMGDIKGDDLVCASWVTVVPDKFPLRAGEKRNIRLAAKMPKADNSPAACFGLLSLRARYADGQSAGETTSLICVENKAVAARPAADGTKMSLALDEGDKYVVQCSFSNTGNVQFSPKCKATLSSPVGGTVADVAMTGPAEPMLPLEVRGFSGLIDFAGVAPGAYTLTAAIEFAAGLQAVKPLVLRVSEEAGSKVITVLQSKDDGTAASQPAGEPK